MGLNGKGFFIWKVRDAEGGSPDEIARAAQLAGYTHVLVKIADGSYPYNFDRQNNIDLAAPVVEALRARKIGVWGWHYVYGNSPTGEAATAVKRLQQLQLDGYVIDAEGEYKEPGKVSAAKIFMERLRQALPSMPVALSSFRFPSYHPQFPWQAFLERCDLNMPQVYWEKAHNPGAQLRRVLREFQALKPSRPVIPTGPAYTVGGWAPTSSDLQEFFQTCHALGMPAVNFFSWDECRARLPGAWDQIASYRWPDQALAQDVPQRLIQALNSHSPEQVAGLYSPMAVHINDARRVQGSQAIKTWYNTLLGDLLPEAVFQLTEASGSGSLRHFHWAADAKAGKVLNGSDTIGLLNGKIAYHFSSFNVTR